VELDFQLFRGAVRQYVFISSASAYAKPAPRLPIREDTPLANPWWDYSRKKIACEQWLLERWQEERFPVTIVRPSHTYSKNWVPNGVSSSSYTLASRLEQGKPVYIHDDGETPWTLTASSDFAVGLAGLLGRSEAVGEAFHITSDEALTWNQIYTEIAAAVGGPAPEIVKVPTDFICQVLPRMVGTLKGDKAHPGVFDNSKIKRFVPGFCCRKPFRVGARESVAWLRAHPEQKNLSPELEADIEAVLRAWKAAPHG
jgi:nucleoside-diphosphate-sugar epimerase